MKKVLESLFLFTIAFSLFSCMTTNQVVTEEETEYVEVVQEKISIEDTQLDSDVDFVVADINFPEYREINNKIEFKSPSISYSNSCKLELARRESVDDLFYTIISIENVNENTVVKDLCIEKGTEYEYKMTVKDNNDKVLYESDVLKIIPISGFGKIKLTKPLLQTYDSSTGVKKLKEEPSLVNPYEELFRKFDYGTRYMLKYNYGNKTALLETIVNERDLTQWVKEEYLEKPLVLTDFYIFVFSNNLEYKYQLPLEAVPDSLYAITIPNTRVDFKLETTSEGNKITIPYNKDAPYFSISKKKEGQPGLQYIDNFKGEPMTEDYTIIDSFVENGAKYTYSFFSYEKTSNGYFSTVSKGRSKTVIANNEVNGELSFSVEPVISFEKPNMVIKTLPILTSNPYITEDDEIKISVNYGANEYYGESVLNFYLGFKKDVNVEDISYYEGNCYLSYVTIELKDKNGITYYQSHTRDNFSDENIPKLINIQR